MNPSRIRRPALRAGFSLLELLFVLGVMSLLMVLAGPALTSMTMGNSLTRAGQLVADQFALARQIAVSHNQDVQVRFLYLNEAPAGYKAIQLWSSSQSNVDIYVPIGPVIQLPNGTVISDKATLSPLIANATIPSSSTTWPGHGSVTYCGFRFRPEGGTDLLFSSTNNFVTAIYTRDQSATEAPANYYAVQVDPLSGHSRTFRP